MMKKVLIGGEGARVAIEVFAYERSGEIEGTDANWLRSRVTVESGGFTAAFDAALMTEDFARLLGELQAALTDFRGKACFTTCEGQLAVEIEVNKRGGAFISGKARTFGGYPQELSFSFESDQSFLKQTVVNLESLVAEFPIRHGRTNG